MTLPILSWKKKYRNNTTEKGFLLAREVEALYSLSYKWILPTDYRDSIAKVTILDTQGLFTIKVDFSVKHVAVRLDMVQYGLLKAVELTESFHGLGKK